MTNKKLKMAAMSVALTACVAASPLAANADAPEAAPKELEKEPVAEETKKEENTAEPQVNQEAKNAQKTLKDAEVKYDKEHPTTNPDGSQKLDGVIVTNPEGSGETNPNPGSGETGGETNPNPNPDSGETNPNPNPDSGETDPNPNPNPGSGETGSEEKKPEEKKPEEKEPEKVVIGTAEKTEKSETNVETKPNPGAEPIVDTTTPPTVEKNPDGSTAITQPTVTPGKETTTTTGSGEAKGNLHEKKEEVKEFDLDEELGKNPDISWDIKEGADAVNGYKVDSVTNSDDGNQQTLKLKKEKETTAEMTAEDIAKLVDAEKPTVNPDGTYTLTRTETILDAEGNPQTRTTYITIRDNKVTTKTTTELTITRKKAEQDGSESFRDEMTYPSIQIKGNDDAVVETIKPEDLEKMLNQGTVMDDGIHFTKDGKEYVIQETTQPGETKLSNAEIVDRLKKDGNKNYELGADGEIYYTTPHNETVKLDVTQNELLRRSLTYTVTLKTTEKGDPGTAGEQIATEKAKKDAIRKALTTAVDQLGIEDPATAAQLKAKISDLKFTQEQLDNGGTFTTEEIGGKIYTLTYSAAGAEVTASTPTTDKTDTGKNPEDITDVMDNTVTGTAYVTGSTIIWKGEDQNYDTGAGTLGMGADFTTAPEGATDVKRDPNTGRITSYKDKQGNTHSFTYEENVDLNALTPEEKTALEAAAKKDGWNTENLTASLTQVKWKVESPRTETQQTTPIENGTPVDLSKKEWSSQDGNNGTVDFTHSGTTYAGMKLESTAADGTKTYKKTDDCVLLNPKLTWSENAGQLVAGKGEQAKLSNRITYDNEGDNDPNTGHHEYPRASWDNPFAKDNAPTKSVFYKVEGQVAYGKLGNDYTSEKRARADLQAYKDAHPGLDLSKAQVVKVYKNQTSYSSYYYQIYLYQSDLAAYGYMSDDNNTCGNALFNADGQRYYVGGYDLTLGNLTQTDKNHVVAMGKNTTALSATFKRRKLETLTNRELRYTPNSVTETIIHESEVTGQGTDLSGSYRADYTKTADYRDEQQQGGIAGTGTGSYKSFTNLIRNIFKGEDTGTVEGGFIKYEYHTEKNKDGTPVKFEADKMVVTTKQDAEVHYTFTSQESRDVWIKGYTQTVVPPVNPGPDSPELPPVEDAKPAPAPAPAPETPVLPVVQDARPDPAPTPAPTPAPAPETPVLPAVQDAKLIQTGTSGWLADLMLGAGMVLSAAGYWMERKRKAMFYKSQH